eukprot:3485102-Pleurochrysis_carterae.AAC.1
MSSEAGSPRGLNRASMWAATSSEFLGANVARRNAGTGAIAQTRPRRQLGGACVRLAAFCRPLRR